MLLRPMPPIKPLSRAFTIAASWSSNRWPAWHRRGTILSLELRGGAQITMIR
jgi:hypothetical protein